VIENRILLRYNFAIWEDLIRNRMKIL
jgi:hypothetical protein